jgi:molybdopterin-guanine dinucleotide biosynthesis protein A
MDLSGIVLAGGQSRRMGANKALLDVGGMPMIQRVLKALRTCCAEVFIVAKDPAAYSRLGVRVVPDDAPEQAPLVGVVAGLRATRTPYAFVAACDVPFLSPDVVAWMATLAPDHDAVVPRVDGRWHPLHAVYAAHAHAALEAEWTSGVRRMSEALRALRIREVSAEDLGAVDPRLRTLRNVNTDSEYRVLLDELAAEEPDKEGPPAITNSSAGDL